jgi:hypothetical protein
MLAFPLASASDFQAFMDIRPTTRLVTAVIPMVTARHIIDQLSIIAPRSGPIIGRMAIAYLFGIATSAVKRLTKFVKTVQSGAAAKFVWPAPNDAED